MKLILLLSLFVVYSAMAATTTIIRDVKSMDLSGDEFLIKFEGDQNVYRVSEGNSTIPCLTNGMRSGMNVALQLEEEAKVIKGCKLASGPLPGMNQAQ